MSHHGPGGGRWDARHPRRGQAGGALNGPPPHRQRPVPAICGLPTNHHSPTDHLTHSGLGRRRPPHHHQQWQSTAAPARAPGRLAHAARSFLAPSWDDLFRPRRRGAPCGEGRGQRRRSLRPARMWGWWWIPLPLVAWLLLTPTANRAVMRAVVSLTAAMRSHHHHHHLCNRISVRGPARTGHEGRAGVSGLPDPWSRGGARLPCPGLLVAAASA
jgi:hypothetical protein